MNKDSHDLLQKLLKKEPQYIIISVPMPFVYRGGTTGTGFERQPVYHSLTSKTSSMEFAINQEGFQIDTTCC